MILILFSHPSNASFTKSIAKQYYEDKTEWLQKIAQNQYRYSSDLEKSEKKHRREGKDLKKKKKVVEDIFYLVSRVEESFSGFGYGVEVN